MPHYSLIVTDPQIFIVHSPNFPLFFILINNLYIFMLATIIQFSNMWIPKVLRGTFLIFLFTIVLT